MVTNRETAAVLLKELIDENAEPVDFWKSVGWDYELVCLVADVGEEIGAGEKSNILAAMQMGAELAVKGIKQKEEAMA